VFRFFKLFPETGNGLNGAHLVDTKSSCEKELKFTANVQSLEKFASFLSNISV